MNRTPRLADRLLLLLSLALLIAGLGWKARTIVSDEPAANWDALAYTACVLALDGRDDRQIRDGAYAAVGAVVSARELDQLKTAGGYRRQVYRDPAMFAQQRRFYQGRLLYVWPMWLAWKAGVPLGLTPTIVSLAGWMLSSILAFVWLARRLPPWLVGPVVLALSLSGPMADAASTASPDTVACAMVVAACWLFVEQRITLAAIAVLALGMLARLDLALLGASAGVLLALVHRRRGWPTIAAGLGIGAGFVAWGRALAHLTDARPWWVLFVFLTRGMRADVDAISPDIDPWLWLEIVYEAIDGAWGSTILAYAALAMVGAWACLARGRGPTAPRAAVALLALAFSLVGRFLAFPRDWDRLLAPWMLAVELLVIVVITLQVGAADAPARDQRA